MATPTFVITKWLHLHLFMLLYKLRENKHYVKNWSQRYYHTWVSVKLVPEVLSHLGDF